MSEELIEGNIRRLLIKELRKDPTLVVLSQWKNVWFGSDLLHRREKRSYLFGEFDVITFKRKRFRRKYKLLVTGYEIKGYTYSKTKKKYNSPNNKRGITQTLGLLYDGADLAYLVRPEPKREADHLIRFCKQFAPKIGLIFVDPALGFDVKKEPKQNSYAHEARKRHMLAFITTSAAEFKRKESYIPNWAFRYPSTHF